MITKNNPSIQNIYFLFYFTKTHLHLTAVFVIGHPVLVDLLAGMGPLGPAPLPPVVDGHVALGLGVTHGLAPVVVQGLLMEAPGGTGSVGQVVAEAALAGLARADACFGQ